MKLVVGLGNPGQEYARNRHNVGFRCLDRLAEAHRLRFAHRLSRAVVASGQVLGVPVLLAKPRTYMNLSGDAILSLLTRYRLKAADLLVVHDDLDLPLGRIRLRPRGSSGGHKGVESIIGRLGTQEFARLRIGIGRPGAQEAYEYVLGDFTAEELPLVREACQAAVAAVECFLTEGLDAAMNRFNAWQPERRTGQLGIQVGASDAP